VGRTRVRRPEPGQAGPCGQSRPQSPARAIHPRSWRLITAGAVATQGTHVTLAGRHPAPHAGPRVAPPPAPSVPPYPRPSQPRTAERRQRFGETLGRQERVVPARDEPDGAPHLGERSRGKGRRRVGCTNTILLEIASFSPGGRVSAPHGSSPQLLPMGAAPDRRHRGCRRGDLGSAGRLRSPGARPQRS
jgi:hypothetical protein